VTHEYTLLLDATVLPGGDQPPCEAIAWAHDTILALGSTDEVVAISRGDSHVLRYPGCFVIPAGDVLGVGEPADLLVLAADPREAGPDTPSSLRAEVRGGRVDPITQPR
jgi:predicted amidohydrolase YtcJ